MKLLQFRVAELAIIVGIRVEIVELAKIHILGAGDDAITIAVHKPEPLGLAKLRAVLIALASCARDIAPWSGAKPDGLKFLQREPVVAASIDRIISRFMPLLKLRPVDEAIPITIKPLKPVTYPKIKRVTVSQAIPVRSVDPIPVTQTVPIGRLKAVAGTILDKVTCCGALCGGHGRRS